MADSSTATAVNRAQLIKAVGGDAQVARMLEASQQAVSVTLPVEVAAVRAAAEAAQQAADGLAVGSLGRRPPMPRDLRPGDLVLIARDAAGAVVSLDLGQLAAFVASVARGPAAAPPVEDAQSVLAARTFNRR